MKPKSDLQAALDQGADHKTLLGIARRHKDRGVTQREVYDTLQRIWLDFGFNDDEGDAPNRLRDELEFAMEIVWGFMQQRTEDLGIVVDQRTSRLIVQR